MPNKKSAMKELRKTKKRTARNSARQKNLAYLVKQTIKAVEKGDKVEATRLAKLVQKAADKAAKGNVIKANTANRQKARVMAKVNGIA